ncbi:pyridoxal phosphate-dependent decarboxylase family protein [Streptacidiphilus monticola]
MSTSSAAPAAPAGPGHSPSDFRAAAHQAADLLADYLTELPARPVWQPMPDAARERLLALPFRSRGARWRNCWTTSARRCCPTPWATGTPASSAGSTPPLPRRRARHPGRVRDEPQHRRRRPRRRAPRADRRAVDRRAGRLPGRARWRAADVRGVHGDHRRPRRGPRPRRAATRGGRARAGLAALPPLTGYVTGETHSCVRKAAQLLGLGSANLRTVATDADGHLDLDALRAAVAEDRAAGRAPFLVVGSAGTVNSGAVDDLEALAGFCAEEQLWFHVDGAYGAFGRLDPASAHRFAGLELADSLALDPHKWLGVPVDCGCLLVRDPAQLRATYSLVPSYLRDDAAGDLGWFSEYGIEQTRPFRSLKVWATLAALGRAGVAASIARCCELARLLGELVEAEPDLELLAPVETSIAAFRFAPAGWPRSAWTR